MHTFFINTSGKKFDDYDVLWDIRHENRKLVSLECAFADWFDAEKGYKNCVKKMSDMIDSYAELDNRFNVIIYVDLTEIPEYARVGAGVLESREHKACISAMHTLYTHVITNSVLSEFSGILKEPENALVMFGEYKVKELSGTASAEPNETDITEKLSEFIGMPGVEEIESVAKKIDSSNEQDKTAAFEREITSVWKEGLFADIVGFYKEEMRLWCDTVMTAKNVESANELFFSQIRKAKNAEIKEPGTISCPFDKATGNNKSTEALNRLNIMMHIIKCVEDDSVFDTGSVFHCIKEFYSYKAEELAVLFRQKERIFSEQLRKTGSFSEFFAQEGLALSPGKFDHKKFSLDEYGDRATDVVVKEAASVGNGEEKATGSYEDLTSLDRVEVVEEELKSLFSEDSYALFKYDEDGINDNPTSKTSPEEHIEYGKKVKRMHLSFLKKFKVHTTERLSAYAGRSKENKGALLKNGEYKYSTDKEKETRSLETVEKISLNAYNTVLKRYMEFCAGRAVSVTDISKHCDIFVTRIYQIKESLSRKKLVFGVAFVALLVLYLPFFLVSGNFMDVNEVTAYSFIAAFVLPVILGITAYIKALSDQKKKYIKEHNILKSESDEIMSGNKIVAEKYDSLLTSVIPSLRWVYEYRLDVEHYAECCRIAELKLAHHKTKLSERVKAMNTILSDIECNMADSNVLYKAGSSVDYGTPYCFGSKNIDFYTVADKSFFESAKKGEEDGE